MCSLLLLKNQNSNIKAFLRNYSLIFLNFKAANDILFEATI